MVYVYKTNPYAHQKEGVARSRSKKAFAWLMEMGTGKTKVAIDEMGILFDEGELDVVLVLAPKGVYMNWVKRELPTHLGVESDIVTWYSGGGNRSQQAELLRVANPDYTAQRLRIVVMNIEALSSGTKGIAYAEKYLRSSQKTAVYVDESTTIKNVSSVRTKNVLKLAKFAKYRRIMTGSPVSNSPLDLFGQFSFLDTTILGTSNFYAFRARYSVLRDMDFGGRRVPVVVAYKNTEDLVQRIEGHSYRVLKEECLDLPEKVYTTREVELTADQQRVYNDIREFAISEFNGGVVSASSAIVQILRLQQVVCGHYTDDDGQTVDLKNNRVDALLDAVSETSGKVVIWARFRRDIQLIVDALSKQYGENSVAQYHGGNTATREADVDRFLSEESCRFMVSNQQTGGYGNTWVVANTVIYYSNDFSLERRLQSEDRTHRSGQTKSVTYIDLVASGTVDLKILQALRNKIDISSQITGDEFRSWVL